MFRTFLVSPIALLALALAGCGGGGSGGSSGYTTAPVPMPTSAPVQTGSAGDAKTAQINGQTILVDAASGLALYEFTGDAANQSNCTGACLTIWPAHAATAAEQASGNFTIFTRADNGTRQWAYKGHPLYTFISDTTANNATGNGIQGFVLTTP